MFVLRVESRGPEAGRKAYPNRLACIPLTASPFSPGLAPPSWWDGGFGVPKPTEGNERSVLLTHKTAVEQHLAPQHQVTVGDFMVGSCLQCNEVVAVAPYTTAAVLCEVTPRGSTTVCCRKVLFRRRSHLSTCSSGQPSLTLTITTIAVDHCRLHPRGVQAGLRAVTYGMQLRL